jgi:two-component system nitrogen regulation sensor histidine kinase GlnL
VSAKQAVNNNISIFFEDTNNFFKNIIEKVDQQKNSYKEHEYFLQTHQKKTICVSLTVSALIDASEEFIIEFIQMDQQLKVAREERMFIQQQANTELLRNLAHEVRNPLGGLRGSAQLLEQELDEESLKEYTQIIINEADRLQNLMNRMLTPHQMPVYKRTNIHEILERVRSLILSEFTSDITFIRDYDVSLPEFIVDREKLIQAILNIARNGAQAMKLNNQDNMQLSFITRAERQIVFRKKKHATAIRIDIIDNGPGIKNELIDKIFFPLVTGNESGSGLGLSLAQNLISLHQGMIDCHSVPGKTVFSIILPIENNLTLTKGKK